MLQFRGDLRILKYVDSESAFMHLVTLDITFEDIMCNFICATDERWSWLTLLDVTRELFET